MFLDSLELELETESMGWVLKFSPFNIPIKGMN